MMIITKQIALHCILCCQKIGGDLGMVEVPENIIKSERTDAEASVLVDHDLRLITVVFKGSKEAKDWVYDMKFHKVTIGYFKDRPVRVHSGFNEQELSIHHEVNEKLYETIKKFPKYTVIGTGHSLGNSLIELFVYRSCWPFNIVIGFGGACTGNMAFKDALFNKINKESFINFIYYNDQIPLLLKNEFNYEKAGKIFTLFEFKGNKEHPANHAAFLFGHDTHMNYYIPVRHLPMQLNESVLS
jgi:hypothetical protein